MFLEGSIQVPPDKSISHRSIMFGAMAHGVTRVHHFLKSEDCLATLNLFKALGVTIYEEGDQLVIVGKGVSSFQPPSEAIDVGNSGTTLRLVSGLLATCCFPITLTGDASLSSRPMDRVLQPLRKMGVASQGQGEKETLPLILQGTSCLKPIQYHLPVASAQVKSALLLAALQAEGPSLIVEKELTRNHTEEMIRLFGGDIQVTGKQIQLTGPQQLTGTTLFVPGDISSAAFFIVAGLCVPNSHIWLTNVGLSETRTGILDIAYEMGGKVKVHPHSDTDYTGDIEVQASELVATTISGSLIPRAIDELPVIALLATQAKGRTVIKDAEELKVKETNRIDATVCELKKLGADIESTEDGMIINGPTPLHGGVVNSYQDHRMAMMLKIASLLVSPTETVQIKGEEAVKVSYPQFNQDLLKIINQ